MQHIASSVSDDGRCRGFVSCRVRNTSFGEAPASQQAGIALAASLSHDRRIVTTESARVVDAELESALNDLCFGEFNKWRVDGQSLPPFHSGLGSQICHCLIGGNVLWTAIGIPAVIQGIYTDEDVLGIQCLRPGK